MSLEIQASVGNNLDVNMVSGRAYDLSDPLAIRVRIGNEESVMSMEQFCVLAERYLQGGIFGWHSVENPQAESMPECVRKTIERLAKLL